MAKVLVVGSGGREHALCYALAQSPKVGEILFAPGNGGSALIDKVRNITYKDYHELYHFAQAEQIDLIVIGPEEPLADGIINYLPGFKAIGWSKYAAKLESSKYFAKRFMERYNIPTAPFKILKDYEQAIEYCNSNLKEDKKLFIKADGLCGGKGSFPAYSEEEAQHALDTIFNQKACGGGAVVIEDALEGEELTCMALVDAQRNYILFPFSRDYKRAYDNDEGPNTGGMGAIAPIEITNEVKIKIESQIIQPTIDALIKSPASSIGILYFGLMISNGQPYLLEYNCRLGDPEAQVILPLIKTDLYELFIAATEGRLNEIDLEWEGAAVCVVLAVEGYPEIYDYQDVEIYGFDSDISNCVIFHAGTEYRNRKFYTKRGRILNIVGLGKNTKQAKENAYSIISQISFEGMRFRKDIGKEENSDEE